MTNEELKNSIASQEKNILEIKNILNKCYNEVNEIKLQEARTSSHIESELGNIRRVLNDYHAEQRDHGNIIYGTDKSSGLLTRVSQLEQQEKSRSWFNKTLATAVIGILVKMLYDSTLK